MINPQNKIAIGTIIKVHGPVVLIDCNPLPPLRQALCTCFDHTTYLLEVHQHLDEHRIRAVKYRLPTFDKACPGQCPTF